MAASICTDVYVKRRTLLSAFAVTAPRVAFGQDRKKIVVGLLSWWPPSMEADYTTRLREGLRAYGYIEGRNLELLAVAGGLLTYGIDDRAQMTRAAYFVDRIVKGTSPADLPTDYVLVVNQKTAAEFGFTVPPALPAARFRGDRVAGKAWVTP